MDLFAEYDKISTKQPGVDTGAFYSTCMALAGRGDVSWEIVGSVGAQCLDHPDLECRVMGRQLLEQGASRRDPTCLINLATSLIRGDGGPRDETRAVSLLLQLCETEGLTGSQRSIVLAMTAERYLSGRGVPQSDARALVYYEAAAELDHSAAIYNAGLLHERAVPPDFVTAAAYYERICEVHCEALTSLGRLHVAKLMPDADPARGIGLLEQAAYIHDDRQALALLELAQAAGLRGARENA